MADRLAFASNELGGWRKILLTAGLYMWDNSHRQDDTQRIPRRCSTLVFARGERALAARGGFPIVAHRAVYSRALLGVPARRGPRQLCALRPQAKPTFLCLRARGVGSAGAGGGEQRPKARK